MQALTNRAQEVSRKPMTFMERLYIPSILKGMSITFSHIFKKQPTIRYPEQKREFSPVFRGLHVLNRDEEGRERCTACGLCAVACPAEAITMEAAERQDGEENLYREEKYAAKYEINMLRCIFCGLCEEACQLSTIFTCVHILFQLSIIFLICCLFLPLPLLLILSPLARGFLIDGSWFQFVMFCS